MLLKKPGLTVVRLSGTPREVGLAHGRMFRGEIALMRERLVAFLSSVSFGLGGRAVLAFFGLVAMRMRRFVPEDLAEEMRGIAEGAGQSYSFIFTLNALDDVFVNFGCSAFALMPEKTGGPLIVGRNLDYPLFHDLLPRLNTVFIFRPEDGLPFVSVAWPGFAGVVTGMNENGVVIADLTSLSKDRTLAGTPALLVNRIALQRSGSLDELVSTVQAARRTVGKNLLAASPSGAAALELSSREFKVRAPEAGVLACTNHYLDLGLAARQGKLRKPPVEGTPEGYFTYAFSKERYDRVMGLSAGDGFTALDAAGILGAEPVANAMTVQSAVFVPAERRILVARAEGTPVSRGVYEDIM